MLKIQKTEEGGLLVCSGLSGSVYGLDRVYISDYDTEEVPLTTTKEYEGVSVLASKNKVELYIERNTGVEILEINMEAVDVVQKAIVSLKPLYFLRREGVEGNIKYTQALFVLDERSKLEEYLEELRQNKK